MDDSPTKPSRLEDSRTPQESGRKHHDAAHHPEHAVNRDTEDAERKKDDPDEWIHHQRQEGEWPAKHQQDAPDEKLPHAVNYDAP